MQEFLSVSAFQAAHIATRLTLISASKSRRISRPQSRCRGGHVMMQTSVLPTSPAAPVARGGPHQNVWVWDARCPGIWMGRTSPKRGPHHVLFRQPKAQGLTGRKAVDALEAPWAQEVEAPWAQEVEAPWAAWAQEAMCRRFHGHKRSFLPGLPIRDRCSSRGASRRGSAQGALLTTLLSGAEADGGGSSLSFLLTCSLSAGGAVPRRARTADPPAPRPEALSAFEGLSALLSTCEIVSEL